MSEHVRYRRGGVLAEIILDRPAKRNALSLAMWRAAGELVARADSDPDVRALLIHGGESGAFAAGADISEFADSYRTAEAAEVTSRTIGDTVDALEGVSKPVIAAIAGACVGGGVSLALAADLRVADETARFAITPGKLGLIYSPADSRRLLRTVGMSAAKDLLFTGRLVGAEEALRLGLIDRLVPSGEALSAARTLASEIAELAPSSVRDTKRMLHALADGGAQQSELYELFLSSFAGEDFQEGYRAFQEKRRPNFGPKDET